MIGTVRREYLDRVFFWNAMDLIRKLDEFKDYYNAHRVHRSLDGVTPALSAGGLRTASATLDRYLWKQHCRALFQTPVVASLLQSTTHGPAARGRTHGTDREFAH